MPTVNEHLRALKKAKEAGDMEAADYIRKQLVAQQHADDKRDYDPTSGMSGLDKVRANFGAGMEKAGLGMAQLLLPKVAERGLGITDESINERRARDRMLAEGTTGGKALQIAGEMAPSLVMPVGAAAGAASKIPALGGLLTKLGVGAKALPTLTADSAILGAAQGAATPTTSDESAVGNSIAGGIAGGLTPGALTLLGKGGSALLKPILPSLQRRGAADMLGGAIVPEGSAPDAAKELLQRFERGAAGGARASERRVVDAPQSLATITQNPKIAQLEKAARANPETAPSWSAFDETSKNARWKALDDVLGNDRSVQAAKEATDTYVRDAIPEVFKAVKKPVLLAGVQDFGTAVQGRLSNAVKNADPAGQEVYGYVKRALDGGNGSPQMLWNIRKTLKSWMDGTPPPGMEGTRGTKVDVHVSEVTKAIDNVLNASTGKRWGKFLERFGEHAQKEATEKAGQNIRNAFLDEVLGTTRGATTGAQNPAITRAKLEQQLAKFGKNKFGEVLDYRQRNVIDQVLNDLRAEEVLQRVTGSMTGGGSQTAPLLALMKKNGGIPGRGMLSDLANVLVGSGERAQRQIINDALQNPQEAMALIQLAAKRRGPLTRTEKNIIQAARAFLASPSALVLTNAAANEAAQ